VRVPLGRYVNYLMPRVYLELLNGGVAGTCFRFDGLSMILEKISGCKQEKKSVAGVCMLSFYYSEFSQLSALGLLVSSSASRNVAVAVRLSRVQQFS
jgi:hypothetical protein